LVAVVLIVPAVVLTSATQRAFALGPSATFAVLMALGFSSALFADWIVRVRAPRNRPSRDR
jgi:hypothetical protein